MFTSHLDARKHTTDTHALTIAVLRPLRFETICVVSDYAIYTIEITGTRVQRMREVVMYRVQVTPKTWRTNENSEQQLKDEFAVAADRCSFDKVLRMTRYPNTQSNLACRLPIQWVV